MPCMDVIADFEKDHVEIIRQDLKYWETELIGLSEDDIVFGYYELMHRMISAEPRRVYFSKEFSCPTEHRNGLNWLVSKLRIGEPTFPHLSRKINKFKAHDKHLSDWGIQHLHLGTSYLPNGLVKGCKLVLFGIFTNTDAYLIDIREHDWYQVELLNIALRNWPHLLKRFEMRGIPAHTTPLTTSDRKRFREINTNTGIVLEDGKLYASPGGGLMGSGHSLHAVMRRDFETEQLRAFLRSVRQDPRPYFAVFYPNFKYRPQSLRLKLTAFGQYFFCTASGSDALLSVWPSYPAKPDSPAINMLRKIRANATIADIAHLALPNNR